MAILFFIIKAAKGSPSNPKEFAQSIAKTQMTSLRAFKEKYPNLSKEELYIEALSTRPGYTKETIKEIVRNAKRDAEKRGAVLKFSEVVLQLVFIEYLKRTNETTRDLSRSLELTEGVSSVIPDDL